jgi:hypothetical protein
MGRVILICLLMTGCAALPFNGKLIEKVVDDRNQSDEPLAPISCQCNVSCNGA